MPNHRRPNRQRSRSVDTWCPSRHSVCDVTTSAEDIAHTLVPRLRYSQGIDHDSFARCEGADDPQRAQLGRVHTDTHASDSLISCHARTGSLRDAVARFVGQSLCIRPRAPDHLLSFRASLFLPRGREEGMHGAGRYDTAGGTGRIVGHRSREKGIGLQRRQ